MPTPTGGTIGGPSAATASTPQQPEWRTTSRLVPFNVPRDSIAAAPPSSPPAATAEPKWWQAYSPVACVVLVVLLIAIVVMAYTLKQSPADTV